MGFVKRRRVLQYASGVLLLVVMVGWAAWLLDQRKSLREYVLEQANGKPTLPLCQWTPIYAADLATLGFSRTGQSWWTNQTLAVLAFKTSGPTPLFVDIGVVKVAGKGVAISSDGGVFRPLSSGFANGEVRLPLPAHAHAGTHVVVIEVAHPRPPSGADQRWLGVAVNKIRVCGASDTHSSEDTRPSTPNS
jgi:hypothetical protein